MIEVSRLKDLNAAKLFLGFRIGAVSRRDFAVFPVQGQRSLRRLKRYFGDKMSVGAQMVVVLKAFVERCVTMRSFAREKRGRVPPKGCNAISATLGLEFRHFGGTISIFPPGRTSELFPMAAHKIPPQDRLSVEILCSSLPQSADFIASYWSTEMTEIDEVKKENESLREKLQKYKQLEEDLMSQRIFEKAKAQLSYWITAGGIVAIIATILGVGQLKDYAKKIADEK